MGTLSLAGFIAVAGELKSSGLPGRVRILGTPAEEGGAGKALLISKGAYASVDACFMAHPAPLYAEYSDEYNGMCFMPNLSAGSVRISFSGKEAHAGFAPWQGVNALDAVVLGYSGVSMMRQQIQPTERVHGIIVHGGVKDNIIPNYSSVEYTVRAPAVDKTVALRERLIKCYEGAATATGCEIKVERGKVYAELQPNKSLCTLFSEVVQDLGIPMMCDFNTSIVNGGATDQGNVSYVVPAIHPVYGIQAGAGEFNHTIGFTNASGTDWAFDRSLLVAEGLAKTAWKVLTNDDVAIKVKKEFEKSKRDRQAAGTDVSLDDLASFDESAFSQAGIVPIRCSCGHEIQ
jgi:amidohydrolase